MNRAPVATVAGVAFVLGWLISRREVVAARREANTDGLTGLTNRTGLMQQLHNRARKGHPYTVFLLDLNGFKLVNDTHGHDAGDALLTCLAARLRDQTDHNLLARLGGDEFVLVLDGVFPGEIALSFAEQLCRIVGQPARLSSLRVRVAVSAAVGIAAARPGESPRCTLRAADQAMYRSKLVGVPHLQTVRTTRAIRERPRVRLRDVRRVRVA